MMIKKFSVSKIIIDFCNRNIVRRSSRFTLKGPVVAESYNRTIRDLLRKPVVEKSNTNWTDKINALTKENNNT